MPVRLVDVTEFVEYEQTLPLNSKLAHIRETAAAKFAWPEVEGFDFRTIPFLFAHVTELFCFVP